MRVTIEKLVYGGSGLARTDLGVVFVPRTAIGDIVDVELVERKSDYAIGRVSSLVEPSPDRQEPSCPNYASAGCCHWQHIRYSRQLEIKESILRETLQRTGRLVWDAPIATIHGPDTEYRLRASFHVQERKLGFVEASGRKVIPITKCTALTQELNDFIPEGNRLLATPEFAEVHEVQTISGPPVLAMFGPHRVGKGPARIEAGGCLYDLHPAAFFQSNRYLLSHFIDQVVFVSRGARKVLDLFCGSGFFSIPIARESEQVLAVESNRTAVRQARLNAKLNDVSNVQFFDGAVETSLNDSPDLKPDLVLMNPPRTGAGRAVAEKVARLSAKKIVYVSCNPSTFGREAAVFAASGYEIKTLSLIDQFPNTYHIETIAVFERR